MKKIFFIIVFVLLFSITVFAKEDLNSEIMQDIDKEFSEFENSLPDYVKDFFPDNILNGNFNDLSLQSINQFDFLDYATNYLLGFAPLILKNFANLLVLFLIISIFNTIKASFHSEGLKQAFSMCSSLCISISVFSAISAILDMCVNFLLILCNTMNSFTPVMSALYIMTGAITSASVSSASMMLFLSIVENFVVYGLVPIIKLCLCFSIVGAISGYVDLSGISRTIKNTFTGVCVFLMSIFSFVMSFQSVLSHSADSLSLRTVRFAIGNFIPVVGGFIGDSMKTVSASFSFIKSSCGVFAIIVIILLILPIVISLILNKLSFDIISGISKSIGVEAESKICDEASNLCSFALSTVLLCSVTFLFALTIFIKSSVVIG